MKKLIFNSLLLFLPMVVFSQTITLDSCRIQARRNYPLLKQYGLIEKTKEYNLSNAGKAYLPQLTFSVKATYQSDVTAIPSALGDVIAKMTGQPFSLPSLSKDQYNANLELTQVVWDGGMVKAQKKSIKASSEAQKQKLNVDLYALNDRIDNLYFGIMLINEQLDQVKTLENELEANYKKISALQKNGVAQQSDLDEIKVEQINAKQKETDLISARRSYVQILSAFTGKKISENVKLETPPLPEVSENAVNKRPELKLFEAQSTLFESQKKAIFASNMPKIGLFVQGGYGRPGLNMFTTAFEPYYIGGIQLTWNISGLYTKKTNIDKINVDERNVEVQKETFLFNNSLLTKQQQNDIDNLKSTIKNDDEIIKLRTNIKNAAEAKINNGTITVTDLLREIDAENMAEQARAIHEIRLYMTVYQLKNNINN